jgi:hypothetical protein
MAGGAPGGMITQQPMLQIPGGAGGGGFLALPGR